jgi:cystathionine beta-lyase/cystathionine gamma-synthase
MNTYPLEQLDLEGAKRLQFHLVEIIARHFNGNSILQAGDYGLWSDLNRPHFTARVEAVLADFFEVEGACMVRGSGTGALRSIMMASLKPGEKLLIHKAPIYPTTQVTMAAMGLQLVQIDFNDLDALKAFQPGNIDFALIQHSRQRFEDRYNLGVVITVLKARHPGLTLIVDDNYVVMRVAKIGVQLGADISTFSFFKLLGPEGLGCVLAGKKLVDRIHKDNYSGGTQVQGVEAMQALRALTLVPVALALQAEVCEEVVQRLNSGEVPGVVRAYIGNAQSRVLLVELEAPCAKQALKASLKYGAAGHPVGAESWYEIAPLFYRISNTFREENPFLADRMIRINPMRAGADLILAILGESIKACKGG